MVVSVRLSPPVYTLLLIVMISLISMHIAVAESSKTKPIVVCTTSVLASIVKDLAGDKVIVEVIASPSICPAHYDIRPSDVDKVGRADIVFYHGFEPWIKDLVRASGTKAPLINISGPWNTPDALKRMYIAVAHYLKQYLHIDVDQRLNECLKAIDKTAKWLKDFAKEHGFIGKPVIVMQWQKKFVEYLGFDVVATFKPPEKVSAKEYEELVKIGKEKGVLLVVDNLQSGTELGKKLASEIGAVEVALTNFPGTAPGLNNMTQVMKFNALRLAEALKYAEIAGTAKEANKLRYEVDTWRTAFLASLSINIVLIACIALMIRKLRKG